MAIARLYKDVDYMGQELYINQDIPNLIPLNFNDCISSAKVKSGTFTLYKDINYSGASVTICSKGGPESNGNYPSPGYLGGHNDVFSSIRINSDEPVG